MMTSLSSGQGIWISLLYSVLIMASIVVIKTPCSKVILGVKRLISAYRFFIVAYHQGKSGQGLNRTET